MDRDYLLEFKIRYTNKDTFLAKRCPFIFNMISIYYSYTKGIIYECNIMVGMNIKIEELHRFRPSNLSFSGIDCNSYSNQWSYRKEMSAKTEQGGIV